MTGGCWFSQSGWINEHNSQRLRWRLRKTHSPDLWPPHTLSHIATCSLHSTLPTCAQAHTGHLTSVQTGLEAAILISPCSYQFQEAETGCMWQGGFCFHAHWTAWRQQGNGGKAPQPPRVSLENRSLTIASKMGKNRSWALQELR